MKKSELLKSIVGKMRELEHVEALIEAVKPDTIALADSSYIDSSKLKLVVKNDYAKFSVMRDWLSKDSGIDFLFEMYWVSDEKVIFSWYSSGKPIELWYQCHYKNIPEELNDQFMSDCIIQEVEETINGVKIICKREV